MKEIIVIVDLPDEYMLRVLKLNLYDGPYDSVKLKAEIKNRLLHDFPELKDVKVNIKKGNPYVGIDVVGIRIYEVLDMMKKLSEAIFNLLEAEKTGRP